jgi:hypothetical protein
VKGAILTTFCFVNNIKHITSETKIPQLLTGMQVLEKVYQNLSETYNPKSIILPQKISVVTQITELPIGSSPKLTYEKFGLFNLQKDKKSESKLWILGIGKNNGYEGDLLGINVNTDSITGEQLAQVLPNLSELKQSLIQVRRDGLFGFDSKLGAKLAGPLQKFLPEYLTRKTQYEGEASKEFESLEFKYKIKRVDEESVRAQKREIITEFSEVLEDMLINT